MGYQTRDLMDAMRGDWQGSHGALRVDGGMAASDWTMQFLSDMLEQPVDRPAVTETTALGAAYLAGLKAGVCESPERMEALWRLERRFEPAMPAQLRHRKYSGWRKAVMRSLTAPSD